MPGGRPPSADGEWKSGTTLKEDAPTVFRTCPAPGEVLGERVPVDLRAQCRRLAAEPGRRLDLFLEGRLPTLTHPVGEPRPGWSRIAEAALG